MKNHLENPEFNTKDLNEKFIVVKVDEQHEGGADEEPTANEIKRTLNQDVVQHKWRYFLALFLVGIFNNNGYVLVQAGSNSLAGAFQE